MEQNFHGFCGFTSNHEKFFNQPQCKPPPLPATGVTYHWSLRVLCVFVRWQCRSSVEKLLILLAPVYGSTAILHSFSQCGVEEHVGRVSW